MGKITFLVLIICIGAAKPVLASPTILLNVTGQPPLNTDARNGFMDEVAIEAFTRIGYSLKTTRLPAERGLKSANTGLVDGEMSRIKGLDKKYNNLVRVPEKIMDWEFVAFSHIPLKMTQGWESLSGKSVAYINGWKILENNIPRTAEVRKTKNAEKLFSLLAKKRTDYAIYELWGGRYLLNKLSLSQINVSQPAFAVKEMFIYLHKKHKSLVPALSAALEDMKKDGSYTKLVNKHLLPLKK